MQELMETFRDSCKCTMTPKPQLTFCKYCSDMLDFLKEKKFAPQTENFVKKPDTQVNMLSAQKTYGQMIKEEEAAVKQRVKCPRNCEGRRINYPQGCTIETCIKLHKKKIAVASVTIAKKEEQHIKRVRKFDRADRKLLEQISGPFGSYTYRNKTRKIVKKQLAENGEKLAPLSHSEHPRLREINFVRRKLGRRPLREWEL